MATEILVTSPDSEIICSRILQYDKNLVFRAWSEPEHLKNWWGPAGFTNTFHEFDFQVGGKWVFTMHGPDKGNYENACTFIKIEPNALIAWDRISKPLFQVVATFETIDNGFTLLTFKMLFYSAEDCEKLKPFVVGKNEENFDKLEIVLANM